MHHEENVPTSKQRIYVVYDFYLSFWSHKHVFKLNLYFSWYLITPNIFHSNVKVGH